jgi:hypothetical protein
MGWREGMQVAEEAAWEQHGRRHSTFYIMRPLILPGAIALALGGAGYGVYRGWQWLSKPSTGDSGVPLVMWILPIILLAATVFAITGTGRARPIGILLVLALSLGAAWFFWLGALISMLA